MGGQHTMGTTDPAATLRGWVAAAVAAMAATLAFGYLPLPWRLGGLPLALAGAVICLLTSVKAYRNPAAGVLRLAAPMATLACGLFALPLAAQLLHYPAALEYEQCRRDALTLRSAAACTREWQHHLEPGDEGSIP